MPLHLSDHAETTITAVRVLNYKTGKKRKTVQLIFKVWDNALLLTDWHVLLTSWRVLLSVIAGNGVPDHSPECYFSESSSFWRQHSLICQTSGEKNVSVTCNMLMIYSFNNCLFCRLIFFNWMRRLSNGKMRNDVIIWLITYTLKYLY